MLSAFFILTIQYFSKYFQTYFLGVVDCCAHLPLTVLV